MIRSVVLLLASSALAGPSYTGPTIASDVVCSSCIGSTELAAGAVPPQQPAIQFTNGQLVVYAEVTSLAHATNAYTAQSVYYIPHLEETGNGRIYDAVLFASSGVANSEARIGLWDASATTLKPDDLCWTSASVDTTVIGTKTTTFAAGTWTSDCTDVKDGSSRFTPPRGSLYWLGYVRDSDGAPTIRTIGLGSARRLGQEAADLTAAPYTGFSQAITYPTLTDPAVPVDYAGQLPLLALRWL